MNDIITVVKEGKCKKAGTFMRGEVESSLRHQPKFILDLVLDVCFLRYRKVPF